MTVILNGDDVSVANRRHAHCRVAMGQG